MRRAAPAGTCAGVSDVAFAGRRTAERRRRDEPVARATGAGAGAAFLHVADAVGGTADGGGRREAIGRAVGAGAGAAFLLVADAGGGTADGGGGGEAIGRAVTACAGAALRDISDAGRGTADRGHRLERGFARSGGRITGVGLLADEGGRTGRAQSQRASACPRCRQRRRGVARGVTGARRVLHQAGDLDDGVRVEVIVRVVLHRRGEGEGAEARKSTRLNSSHRTIS